MTAPAIALGDLTDPRVLRLLEDHLADMHATSPPESVHALDVTGLQHPAVTFWALSDGDDVLGCVALKELAPDHGELKSMRTDAAARGRGLGRLLLAHVLDEARARGYTRLSLETGTEDFFRPARALYASAGFTETGPFADYVLDPNSVYMTLELGG
ncbi:GNAT family N-acetyltransferase [Protaetiibacter sp. SSC-01]|uniref:GNAT family N-acetyltransferase n=1 Tax=Protaetiibacter sp. SSC-01 TaxID=2759943 RepID=UPI001656F52A|nr:GNAT family N-acetyltransferase [Protaetiibacter sp. SSC-01]QNO37987.1 GNAT family N-acetyltransferase [Protaetiibacter sp. SSC-01]